MKIKKINKLQDKEFTVDIEIANTHTYQLDNGVVSHNTVSQLVGCAAGLHPRYSPYYIRRVRSTRSDAICQLLMNKGVPWQPEVGQTVENFTTAVFEFPIKSPNKAVFRNEKNALEQLEHWKVVQDSWCEHKPSITVYVKDHEWLEVGSWVYKNWNYISGISFLSFDGGIYKLAPYTEITEEEFKQACKDFPKGLNFDGLSELEQEDHTIGASEKACSSGNCDLY